MDKMRTGLEWLELTDPATGKTYFYNTRTKAKQWTAPGEPPPAPPAPHQYANPDDDELSRMVTAVQPQEAQGLQEGDAAHAHLDAVLQEAKEEASRIVEQVLWSRNVLSFP